MGANKILKNFILAGLFFLPFIAFIVSSSMLFPFITGKNFAFRIIVEIVFVLWVILALRDREYLPKFTWILGIFGIFILIVGVADFLGENSVKSFWSNFERMEGYLAIIHLFLYFVVLSSVLKTQKLWNRYWGTWVGSSLIMGIYGLFQLGGKVTINQGGVRVDGTLGNATYLAVFMLFSIFLSTYLFLRSQDKSKTVWFYIPIVILQTVILYNTATRGAILGLIGGVMVTVFLALFLEKENKKFRKTSLAILIGLIILIGSFWAIRNTSFVKDSPVLSRFSISLSDIKTQGRYFIWPMAVKGGLEHPVLGWGQENFNYIFNKDYDPKMYGQEQWFDRAHSTPLDWFVAAGFLGLISYLALYIFALFYLWRKNETFSLIEKSLFTGILGAYFFQSIFVFDNLFSYVLFFSVLAAIHSMSGREMKINETLHNTLKVPVSVLAVIALIFSLYFFNIRPIQGSQSLIDALRSTATAPSMESLDFFERALSKSPLGRQEAREQLANSVSTFTNQKIPVEVRTRYIELTRSELEKQIKETPNDARYYTFYGTFLRNIGDTDKALTILEQGVKLSPRKQTLMFEIGTTKLVAEDFEGALAIFKEAYELEPSYIEAKKLYAIGALYANEHELANNLLNEIPRDSILYDDRIVNVLVDLARYQDIIDILSARIAEGRDELQNNISLSISYLRLGQRQKSIEILRGFIERHPEFKDQIDPYIKEIQAGKNF